MASSTALYNAVVSGDVAAVERALQATEVHVNGADSYGGSALRLACYRGHGAIVDVLIAHGADLEHTDLVGDSAIMKASCRGKWRTVEKLLAAGARVDHENKAGTTALQVAAEHNHTNIIERLLAAGADVHHVDVDGATALNLASEAEHMGSLEALLAAGADVDHDGTNVRSPLARAAYMGQLDLIQRLLAAGADVNFTNSSGEGPLWFAAYAGYPENVRAVEALLQAGVLVDGEGGLCKTPLLAAIRRGCLPIVDVLLAAGADANRVDQKGTSPLMCAAEGGVETVQRLLVAGARVDYKRPDGVTALSVAIAKRQMEVVEMLRAAGALERASVLEAAAWTQHVMLSSTLVVFAKSHLRRHVPC